MVEMVRRGQILDIFEGTVDRLTDLAGRSHVGCKGKRRLKITSKFWGLCSWEDGVAIC